MKKLFLFAATAMLFAACTSEDVVAPQTGQLTADDGAVGFDVYVPGAAQTRAGLEGTMTTTRLQRSEINKGGFGVYAFLVNDSKTGAGEGTNATAYAPGDGSEPNVPDFMVNQKLLWDAQSMGWYYNPIKYWPNETDNDSQTPAATMEGPTPLSTGYSHLDRLTFFAYAPYVSAGANEVGVTGITDKNGKLVPKYTLGGDFEIPKDPSVSYKAEVNNPNKVVDLVWGVAPSGGMNYTAVNGTNVSKEEGLPLIDMTKPDVNTNMKFLFEHALARIGITAVAAIDQVSPGGKLDPNTKITIEKISLRGHFGTTGILNLNNNQEGHKHPDIANWTRIDETDVVGATAIPTYTTLTLTKDYIAEHLRHIATEGAGSPALYTKDHRVGVTTVRQNVIAPSAPEGETGHSTFWSTNKKYTTTVPYSETTPFYDSEGCTSKVSATITNATAPEYLCTLSSDGIYTSSDADVDLTYPDVNKYYVVKFKKVVSSVSDATKEVTAAAAAGKQAYKRTGSDPYTFSPILPVGTDAVADADNYIIDGEVVKAAPVYAANSTTGYWTRDANYFMVVPTDNILYYNNLTPEEIQELHTVTVQIEYYITTEDAALKDGRVITKNVVVKDVVFPSIVNGKSYNLNLVLGLTSVKVEAEVGDWQFVNVQGDLPQNTPGE